MSIRERILQETENAPVGILVLWYYDIPVLI
jgi:hypothetical protein